MSHPYIHRLFLICVLIGATLSACHRSDNNKKLRTDIYEQDLKRHITYLASDDMKGREAGSPQEAMAANYISDWFEHFGLIPAGDGQTYIQEFSITKGRKQGPPFSYLLFRDSRFASSSTAAQPWGQSCNGTVSGKLTFAGYGIDAPELNYNDFSNIDVEGRIVMVLRYGPSGNNNPHDDFGSYWDLNKKVETAIDHGARGVIISNGPAHISPENDTIPPLTYDPMRSDSDVPVIEITAKTASYIMQELGHNLSDIQQSIDNRNQPNSFLLDEEVSISVHLQEDKRIARNVIGLVEGTEHPERYIVIGAHFDHLGMGGSGSLDSSGEPRIHNGADDNASGTAGLLELAQYYAENPPPVSLQFIGFSAEEAGLLGSNYYVKNPTVALDQVTAMINMDMIGRLRDELIIFGVGTSNGWDAVLDSAAHHLADSLTVERVPDGSGASDHTSFYQKKLPVLHYFTDTHADYHRPSDDPAYINFAGTEHVLEHLSAVIDVLSEIPPSDFHYTKAEETQRQDMKLSGPTLGVLPDYGFKGDGMRITGVSGNGPAERAGMQGGDVIVKLAGKEVQDIYDYMGVLNTLSKGDKTTVTVSRDGKQVQLDLTL